MNDTALLVLSGWQREHSEAEAAEIRDTIEAYADLARFDVDEAEAQRVNDRRRKDLAGRVLRRSQRFPQTQNG